MDDLEQTVVQQMDLVRGWCRERPIKLCVLFGSQATGQQHADSDVDLAVWPLEPPTAQTKLAWLHSLERLLDKPVSLVLVSADLDPVLGFEIVKNGRLIHAQAADLWPHHRAQLWHAYVDSWPFRQAARQQLRQFAEGVNRGA